LLFCEQKAASFDVALMPENLFEQTQFGISFLFPDRFSNFYQIQERQTIYRKPALRCVLSKV